MAKVKVALGCAACGQPASQWAGRCSACGEWGTIEARVTAPQRPMDRPAVVSLVADAPEQRIATGFGGVDRVLGGGLVRGSVVLVAGEPGIGKSTLLLQIAAAVGSAEQPALYASGEESLAQVAARARRLAIASERVSFAPGRDVHEVLEAASATAPPLLVVDSIQAMRDPGQAALAGGVSQVRACADALVGLAKREGIAVLVAGQVTKDGDVAGPRTLEHAVDVVCSFDGDAGSGLRLLAARKNRFGEEGEVAWFEMGPGGLTEVDPPSLHATEGHPGAATAIVRAGRSALVVEVQALAAMLDASPRRSASGIDQRRFSMVAAVTDVALELRLGRSEVYAATAGGIHVDDPAADLAVAAALASSVTGTPVPPRSAFVGELTLNGLVRPAPGLGARIRAARAAGLERVFCAVDPRLDPPPEAVPVRTLKDAVAWILGRGTGTPGSRGSPPARASGRPK